VIVAVSERPSLLLALVCLVATLFSNPRREVRRKIRVLVVGALVGLGPVVLAAVLSDLGLWQAPAGSPACCT